jgi:hypothetical protein
LRSVLRIARLANYELSWRRPGMTWHDPAARTFPALAGAWQTPVELA